jgi:hypothetical protein
VVPLRGGPLAPGARPPPFVECPTVEAEALVQGRAGDSRSPPSGPPLRGGGGRGEPSSAPGLDLTGTLLRAGRGLETLPRIRGPHLRDYTPEPAVRTAFPLGQNWKGTLSCRVNRGLGAVIVPSSIRSPKGKLNYPSIHVVFHLKD